MIHKFNQFVNESNSGQNPLSAIEQINKPYSEFIERAEERLDIFKQKIAELLKEMDTAIERVYNEFDDIITGSEPEVNVNYNLSYITAVIHTNIPNNDESWENDDSPAQDLEYRLNSRFGSLKNVGVSVGHKPDSDGNCVIELDMYVIDDTHFGDYTDALETLGEEW